MPLRSAANGTRTRQAGRSCGRNGNEVMLPVEAIEEAADRIDRAGLARHVTDHRPASGSSPARRTHSRPRHSLLMQSGPASSPIVELGARARAGRRSVLYSSTRTGARVGQDAGGHGAERRAGRYLPRRRGQRTAHWRCPTPTRAGRRPKPAPPPSVVLAVRW